MEDLDASEGGDRASKLKALFAYEQQKLQVGNATFQYQPPKLPQTTKSLHKVLFSAEVSDVELLSTVRQDSYGSCSIVIEGDEQTSRVVVHTLSRISVLELNLTEDISLMPEAGTDCWASIKTKDYSLRGKFCSADAWLEFAKAYTYARFLAQQSIAIFQDVTLPRDNFRGLEDGDTVLVHYKKFVTRSLESGFKETSGQSVKLELGSGVFERLEEGIKGMLKGGRRLVLFKDLDQVSVLYDSTVARVRKRKLMNKTDPEPPDIKPESPSEPMAGADTISDLISDRLARMARAGAAINLHLFGPVTHKQETNSVQKLESPEATEKQQSIGVIDEGEANVIEVQVDSRPTAEETSFDRLELMQDIRQSQSCISKAVAELSSKIELLVDPKLKLLNLEATDTESSPEEDNIVRMMAENRELKRRVFDARSQSASSDDRKCKFAEERQRTMEKDSQETTLLETVMSEIYKNMESVMIAEQNLDPGIRFSLLSSLEQNLESAKATLLTSTDFEAALKDDSFSGLRTNF